MNGSCEIEDGLRIARKLLLAINELGFPAATQFLDPIVPQTLDDLITWAAVGARTTESQTHREMASGLSMPVGFKNGTDGSLQIAIDAMSSARRPTVSSALTRMVLQVWCAPKEIPTAILCCAAGGHAPITPQSIADAAAQLTQHRLPPVLMVDCSHANSLKQHARQEDVWRSLIEQRAAGTRPLIGAMIESYLKEGNQPIPANLHDMAYGVSITDACVGWGTTEQMLRHGHAILSSAPRQQEAVAI